MVFSSPPPATMKLNFDAVVSTCVVRDHTVELLMTYLEIIGPCDPL